MGGPLRPKYILHSYMEPLGESAYCPKNLPQAQVPKYWGLGFRVRLAENHSF